MGHIGKDKRTKTKRLDRKESLDTIEEELENRPKYVLSIREIGIMGHGEIGHIRSNTKAKWKEKRKMYK